MVSRMAWRHTHTHTHTHTQGFPFFVRLCAILLMVMGMQFSMTVKAQNTFAYGDCKIIGPQKIITPSIEEVEGEFYIRVQFTVIGKSDGSMMFPDTAITHLQTALDTSFNPYGIYFLYDCPLTVRNDSLYDGNPQWDECLWEDLNYSVSPIREDAINIYVRMNNFTTEAPVAFSGGIGNNYFLLQANLANPVLDIYPWHSMIQHEMGHCLGLYHTAHGSGLNEEVYYLMGSEGKEPNLLSYEWKSCATQNWIGYDSIGVEYVDGSNGAHAGDYVSDTPASNHCLELNLSSYMEKCAVPYEKYRYGAFPGLTDSIWIVDTNSVLRYDPFYGYYCTLTRSRFRNSLELAPIVDPSGAYYYIYADEDSYYSVIDEVLGNFMSESRYQSCRNHFTPGQVKRMRSLLKHDSALVSIQLDTKEALTFCVCPEPGEIEITRDTIYDQDVVMKKDLVVKTGSELIVTGTLRFAPGRHLYVERGAILRLRGGTLTASCPEQLWSGIRVQGNALKEQPDFSTPIDQLDPTDAGMVITSGFGGNIATIAYAKVGMSTRDNRVQQQWPEAEEYWGGVIYAHNTVFLNNKKGVEFMRYGDVDIQHRPNKSFFKYCTFEDENDIAPRSYRKTGITMWSTYGIELTTCIFRNLNGAGLSGIDYGAYIYNNNIIEENNVGISAYSTAPFVGALVIGKDDASVAPNFFENNNADIIVKGAGRPVNASIAGLNVVGNEFLINPINEPRLSSGITIEGKTIFTVAKNKFNQVLRPFRIKNTGSRESLFSCNWIEYSSSSIPRFYPTGIIAEGYNKRFEFLQNTFYIALSCGPDVKVKALEPNQEVVNYRIGGPDNPAKNLFSKGGRVEIETVGQSDTFTYYLPPGITNPTNRFYPASWQYNRFAINYSDGYGKDRCKDQVRLTPMAEGGGLEGDSLWAGIATYWNLGNYDKVKELYRDLGTTEGLRSLYGVYLALGQLDSAAIILYSLPETELDDIYFKQAQKMNLQRLETGQWPVFWTHEEREKLYSIAESDELSAIYAEGLLRLAGIEIEQEIDNSPCQMTTPRGILEEEPGSDRISLHPNPARERIYLLWEKGTEYEYEIYDMRGKRVVEGWNLQSGDDISTANLMRGNYLIRLRAKDGNIETLKFVIQ